MSLMNLTGLPHPSGVRGFKSHLPHLEFIVVRRQTYQHLKLKIVCSNTTTDSRRRTVYLVDKTIQLMHKGLFRQWLE